MYGVIHQFTCDKCQYRTNASSYELPKEWVTLFEDVFTAIPQFHLCPSCAQNLINWIWGSNGPPS